MCAAAVINSNKSIGVLMWDRETVQGIRMVMYACSQFGEMKAVSKIPIILSCSSVLITKNYIINSTIFHRQMTNSVNTFQQERQETQMFPPHFLLAVVSAFSRPPDTKRCCCLVFANTSMSGQTSNCQRAELRYSCVTYSQLLEATQSAVWETIHFVGDLLTITTTGV